MLSLALSSEAKGHVVQRLAERSTEQGRPTQVVRVAGPNAGHTGYDKSGQAWALRQVPVAAVIDNPVILGIAAGSEIDPPVLLDEYDRLRDAGLMAGKLLWVSGEATLIDDEHKAMEADLNLINRIGSTGKGIGAARAERLRRNALRVKDSDWFLSELGKRGIPVADEDHNVANGMGPNGHTIIEGTQGFGLGLRGGFYPQCTSSDCRAADFMSMAGVHAWEFEDVAVWAVARIFPIRVAGNSGPLRNETTWEELGLPEERTTVTKKVRRVGYPDWDLVRRAVAANGGAPTVRLALTMVDQIFPAVRDRRVEDIAYMTGLAFRRGSGQRMLRRLGVDNIRAGVPDPELTPEIIGGDLGAMIADIERQTTAKIAMITTGPNTGSFL